MADADEQLLASADGRLDDLRERLVPAEALRADLEPSTPAREEKLARLAELQAEVKKLQAEIDPEALPVSSPPPERGSFVSMALPPALARAMVMCAPLSPSPAVLCRGLRGSAACLTLTSPARCAVTGCRAGSGR